LIEPRARKGRKKMKKRILASALALTMVASVFTGCGSGSSGSSSSSSRNTTDFSSDQLMQNFKTNQAINTTDNITLLVWESKNGPDEFIQKAGEKFHQLYPNITIKYENVESTDANSRIVLDGPAGNGADLFATAHNNIGVMASGEVIYPVPDTEKDIVSSSCTASALAGATLNAADGTSTLYGYPVSTETYALFYNKKLIQEANVPKTMGELVEYIKSFDTSTGVKPFLLDAGNAYYSVMFTSTKDNHLYGPEGNDITDTHMVSDDAVAQLEDFKALSAAIAMPAEDISYSTNDGLFKSGMLAMEVSGAWNIRSFEEAGIDFGITAIPALTNSGEAPANFMGVRCMFVSNYSEHKPEAVAFAEFLMTKEMQQLRCELTTTMPARDDVLDSIADESIKTYLNGLNEQLQHSYPMPNMSQASLFWTAFGAAYANIWNGSATDVRAELTTADGSATKK